MRPFGTIPRIALAAVLGTAAWLHPLTLPLFLALPAMLHNAPTTGRLSRHLRGARWPTLVAVAWWLPGNLTLVPVVSSYFGADTSPLLIAGLPLGLTALQVIPFVVIAPAAASPRTKAVRMAIALALTIIPPFGLFFWRSPFSLAGVLFPGSGWFGLIAIMVVMATIAGRYARTLPLMAALGAVALVYNAAHWLAPRVTDGRWVAVNTAYSGETPIAGSRGADITMRVTPLLRRGAVVVLPESVLAPITAADEVELNLLDERARRLGATVILGVSTPHDAGGYWRNGVMALGAERGWRYQVQVPMPAGHWRPWLGGVRARFFGSDLVSVAGTIASVSVCYEDLIVWPHRGLLSGRSRVMISMGNRWALSGTYAAHAQDVAAGAMARLNGALLIRATNEYRE